MDYSSFMRVEKTPENVNMLYQLKFFGGIV
jgi:hypothetical protein